MSVPIQQAASNALAAWIASQMTDCAVSQAWPSPDFPLPAKGISVLTAGTRHDIDIDLRFIDQVDVDSLMTNATWQIKVCEQRIQIDVWAVSDIERDDIMYRLDTVLNQGESQLPGFQDPVGNGIALQVGDGYPSTFADFQFDGPDTPDDTDSVKRSEYRGTITGTAYVALTITKSVAKQIQLILKEKIHNGTPANTNLLFDITTLTPAGQTGSTGT